MTKRQMPRARRASEIKRAEKLAKAGYVKSARALLKRNEVRDQLVIIEVNPEIKDDDDR